ncbi:Hydrolase, isochorismatase family, Isochorismatase [Cupriavidus necator H850]|uniref:cysteine hydrolase family protein n=1 Tax=Cupriavidus necator TaxID=106590 RepID=UPI00129D5C4B|nr:Hydrolase, isochorismatase family, Isochorismatase [Cupriavidus necator H850]
MTNTAFIGLDYIVDITHPDGKIAHAARQVAEHDVIGAANRALRFARSRNWLTILVKVGFAQGYADQPRHSPLFGRAHETGAIELGTPGTAFHPGLDQQLADLVIVKPRVSAFYGTGLDAALRARGVQRLVVAGVSSAWAVQGTVRDAHDRDYEVLVLEDGCAAANEALHRTSMELLGAIARVIRIDGLAELD